MKLAWLVVPVALLGCDKKKSGSDDGADKAEGNGKGGCQVPASAKLADIIPGKTVGMLQPFGAIKLGMSSDDAKKACPNVFGKEAKTGTYSVGDIVGKFGETYLYGRFDFTNDKLAQVEWKLPAEAAAALTTAWSAPKESAGAKKALVWLDETSGLRAILEPGDGKERELAISSFVPLRAFVESDPKVIAFKPAAILGKKPADLAKEFPQFVRASTTSAAVKEKTKAMMADMEKDLKAHGIDPNKSSNDLEVRLPPTPMGAGTETHGIFHLDDDGTVREYGVWFRTSRIGSDFSFPDEPAQVVKLMDELWGPHKTVKDILGDKALWFDAKAGIRASAEIDPAKPDALDIGYVRYLPLANFFGAPGALWGFEKAELPLLGATTEALTAAYGAAFVVKDATATLTLPPTDYAGDTAVTTILIFLDGNKVREWRTSIPFKEYEPARAEYEAALDAKFGAGKPAKEHVLYGKGGKVDVQYSKYTHALDIEVTK